MDLPANPALQGTKGHLEILDLRVTQDRKVPTAPQDHRVRKDLKGPQDLLGRS